MKKQIVLCITLSLYSQATLAMYAFMGGSYSFDTIRPDLKKNLENQSIDLKSHFIAIDKNTFENLTALAFYNKKLSLTSIILFPEDLITLSQKKWNEQAEAHYFSKHKIDKIPGPSYEEPYEKVYISLEYVIKRLLPNLRCSSMWLQSNPPKIPIVFFWITVEHISGHLSHLISDEGDSTAIKSLKKYNGIIVSKKNAAPSLSEKKVWPRVLCLSAIAILPLIYYHQPILASFTVLKEQLKALI